MKTLTLLLALLLTLNAEAMTRYEADVIAAVLVLEAGGEGRIGMEAVAESIWNRADRPRWWGRTPYDVAVKPWQYSCLNGISGEQAITKAQRHAQWPTAQSIVNRFNSGNRTNHSKGATHYYAPKKANPSWKDKLPLTAVIGNHRFHYER